MYFGPEPFRALVSNSFVGLQSQNVLEPLMFCSPPTLKLQPAFLHLSTVSLLLSHTHINTSCRMLHLFSSKGWDAAPPSILYTLVHCLFKSHTVTKAGCASTGERQRVRRECDQGGACYYNLSSIRLHGSQWDYCSLFGLECGKTDLTRRNTDLHY